MTGFGWEACDENDQSKYSGIWNVDTSSICADEIEILFLEKSIFCYKINAQWFFSV